MEPDHLLALFPGRTDAHGFSPADGKFSTKRQPLKPIHAKAHLAGEVRIRRHFVLPDDTCHMAVIDVDDGGVTPVLDIRDVLRKHRLPFAVEKSKSKGYHVWLWFASPVPAWKARAVLRALVAEAGWPDVEVFPKQVTVDGDGLGNFVWLPLHGASVKEGRTLFLNISEDKWPPYPDQAAFLASVPKVSEATLDAIIADKGIQAPTERKAPAANNGDGASSAGTTTLPLPPCAAKAYAEGITSPGRSDWAHFLARHFRRRGLPEEAAVRLLLDWNQKNKPEPLPPDKIAASAHTAYSKEYTSLGCEYLKGAREICGDACVTKGKDAQQGHKTAEAAPDGDCTREGDDFTYTWPALGVEIRVTRLRDGGDGPQGELSVEADRRALHWGRAYLASVSAREGIVKKLNAINSEFGWRDILEQVCRRTTEALRATTPTVQLVPARAPAGRHLVDKLVLDHETNVWFADGGTGKSLLALAVAVSVATGRALPAGLTPRHTGPVFYLDYESCKEEQEERLDGLLAGLGIPAPVPVHYRRMAGALADEVPTLRTEVARLGAVLVVLDSLVPACGAEPEGTDASTRTLNALRYLGPPSVVLAHVSKAQADQKGAMRPFGSVFVMNLPRNVWELRRAEEDEEHTLTIGAYHRKTNRGRLLAPFGVVFEFTDPIIRVKGIDIAHTPNLRDRAGLRYSILATLRGGWQTIEGVTAILEANPDSVRRTMTRLEDDGLVIRRPDQRPAQFGLKA